MSNYKHLFFDLDRTLSDFDGNNRNTMLELYTSFDLKNKLNVDFDLFFETYKTVNKMLWDAYEREEIKKEHLHVDRFHLTFKELKYDNLLMAVKFAEAYIENVPKQNALMPYAKEVLEFLKPNFKLYIITNGFIELQHQKLQNSGIAHLFDDVFISESIGFQKPHIAFFEHILEKTGATKEESLIIGDNMKADIQGAKNIGIASVLYNPNNENDLEPDYRIDSLLELKGILE